MKNIIIALLAFVILAGGIYYFVTRDTTLGVDVPRGDTVTEDTTPTPDPDDTSNEDQEEPENDTETVLGSSVEERNIVAYHYGTGDTELLFVGGIHGGYSWNTSLVAYELMDYLEANPDAVPEDIRVTVVPVLNPDGLAAVVGTEGRFTEADVTSSESTQIAGRFNANQVDLNRNFDCDWEADATWQNRSVSGGGAAFSEPESQAIRDYIERTNPAGVVVWYSAAGGVFTSNCHSGVLAETETMTNIYADASGYRAYEEFDFYEITGDMVNWLAKEGIPGISVLLTTHEVVEWEKNRAGIEALFEHFTDTE